MTDAPKTKTIVVIPSHSNGEIEVPFVGVTFSEVRDGHLFINSPGLTAVFSPGSWLRAQTEPYDG